MQGQAATRTPHQCSASLHFPPSSTCYLSLMSITLRHVTDSGSMSSLTKALFSSAVSSSGSVLLMPNFFNRRSMTGAKERLPWKQQRRVGGSWHATCCSYLCRTKTSQLVHHSPVCEPKAGKVLSFAVCQHPCCHTLKTKTRQQ